MAITTPALYAIEHGMVLVPEAYEHANTVLQTEGIDPLQAFSDSEVRRHHFAVACDFLRDATALQTLASLAFTDRNLGSTLLQLATSDQDLQTIAQDLDSNLNRLHCSLPSVCRYIIDLRKFDPTKNGSDT